MYSTDPVYDAMRHYDAQDRYDKAKERAEESAVEAFLRITDKCDPHARATFAPQEHDQKLSKKLGFKVMEHPTITEVLAEETYWDEGKCATSRVWDIVLKAARGDNVQVAAQTLLEDAARSWAENNAEADLDDEPDDFQHTEG